MRRKNKSLYLILIVVILLGISIGYAAISKTLMINGNSEVKENTWDIHFENIQVTMGSVTAIKKAVIEDELSVDFSVNLNLPGDFYEFTVDVVNSGTIDAMLDNVVKIPELTEQQTKYLNYTIEYINNEQIEPKQLIKSSEYVRYKVRVEYKTDLTEEDLPTITETLNLGFTVNYVQADNTGISVKYNGLIKPVTNGNLNGISTIVTIGTEQFYTIGTDGENVKLLSKYNLHVGSKFDDTNYIVPLKKTFGIQNETSIGWFYGYSLSNPIIGVTSFSANGYWNDNISEYPAYVYNQNSYIYEYVENYKNYLINLGANINSARLISLEELKSLGCNLNELSCENAPSFVYLTTFWSGTAVDNNHLYHISKYGGFDNKATLSDGRYLGVRPVIVIPKSDIILENPIIKFTIDETTYYAEEGMIWEEWLESEYSVNWFIENGENIVTYSGNYIMNGSNYILKSDVIIPNNQYLLSYVYLGPQ